MCCDRPSARPPAPPSEWRKSSREEILGRIKSTEAKSQQLKTDRGIPNFLEMHYNYIGHTPGSREEKYLSANEVRLGGSAQSYGDWHKRHTEAPKAVQKRVATYRNDDGTTRSFEYMKVEVPKVYTGTIKGNTITAGSIHDFDRPYSKEEHIRNLHWLRTREWIPSGPVYGHDDDPEGAEYQNYRRAMVPDYAQIMSDKDYEIYSGTPRGPVPIPQGPLPRPYPSDLRTLGGDARMYMYDHDQDYASLNIASTLFTITSIGVMIINLMGG